MTVKEFKKIVASLPESIDDKMVKLEYPTETGVSGLTDIKFIDWDEADLIFSYFDYENLK